MAAAHIPLLIEYAQLTWARPHYRFFPLVPVGSVLLAIRAVKGLGVLTSGSRTAFHVWMASAVFLLSIAVVMDSPWLGAIAILVALGAGSFAVGGSVLVRGLLPAWLILWLAIPLPLGLDRSLINRLQTLITHWSSAILDVIGVFHATEGNVVKVPGRRLLIEDACSGIHSLFAVVSCTLLFVFWVRRSAIRSLLLVGAAALWAQVANLVRVLGVAVVGTRWGLAVDAGWGHELFGTVLFAAALLLVVSTDRLLDFVMPADLFRRGSANDRISVAQPTQLATATIFPPFRQTGLASPLVAFGYGAVVLAQLSIHWFSTGDRTPVALRDITEDMLPAEWQGWERSGFETRERPGYLHPIWGEYAKVWHYRNRRDEAEAIVILAPHSEYWYELTNCYRGQGWDLQQRNVRERSDASKSGFERFVEVDLRKAGQHAYLAFVQFDSQFYEVTPPLEPNATPFAERFRARFKRWTGIERVIGRRAEWTTYSLQVFQQRYQPIGVADRQSTQALLFHVQELLADHWTQPVRTSP